MNSSRPVIRLETPADYRAVENLTREAFWNQNVPGCDEHYLVHTMRDHADFIPELAFVLMHGDNARCCHIGSPPFCKKERLLPAKAEALINVVTLRQVGAKFRYPYTLS